MESRSVAEPLQSLSSQQNSRHRSLSINNNDGNKKKKKRRRRRRRNTPKMEHKSSNVRNNLIEDVAFGHPTTSSDKSSWCFSETPPVLRPVGAQVPRAPENSTQFIMDDHENSTLFVNFDNFSTPHWEQEPPTSGGEEDPIIGTPSGTPTHPLNRDWFPFNLADFETAYQSAREDKLMAGSSQDLRAAIVSLEARAAVLSDALSASPSRLLATLQAQLLQLQEENAALRLRLFRRQQNNETTIEQKFQAPQSSSSSSTDSDSESDSTNSSSDCSESDCDTCAARRQRAVSDDEKENTRPVQLTSSQDSNTTLAQ
ncbi:hypothetical protein SK128_024701 [Halocaridina rubra]|uniref:Uncharacterized protein n=1 Tax=Halocaridina rubra TaxID=373956 RepID=A0AAN9ABR5_HALRR